MHSFSLIPWPGYLERKSGQWILQASTQIQASEALYNEAYYLADILRKATGFAVEISDVPCDDAIILEIDCALANLGKEGYRLAIDDHLVRLSAMTSTGIFYALQTLLQLFPPAIYGQGPRPDAIYFLPQVIIEDSPRYSWRGAMLDCSRYFRSVEFTKKFIDLLALHKLNIFHWHLTDDQGWRIEIKKFPRLTDVGAWREGTWLGHSSSNSRHDGVVHGGFYSQDEVREIVHYAANRHVSIVPEIEMPGHSQAALAAYPEFGCTGETVEVGTQWGVSEMIYHPKNGTISFLKEVLREVIDLFPCPFIHIGGDEAVKTQWQQRAEIVEMQESVGAANLEELQSYFIRQINEFLKMNGRRLIGWDEILNDKLVEDAIIMSWRGVDGGVKAANHGHDVVMTPASHTYLDQYQNHPATEEPLAIGGYLSLEKTYGFEPAEGPIRSEMKHHVLGLQGQLWGEYTPSDQRVEYMAFPRLCSLAEVGWSAPAKRNFAAFEKGLKKHMKRLELLEVKYCAFYSGNTSDLNLSGLSESGLEGVVYLRDEEVDEDLDKKLRAMFLIAFPSEASYLARQRFFRECPQHRWLIFDAQRNPVAHLAVFEKSIGTPKGPFRVAGVAEVCVAPAYRRQGLTKVLITEMDAWIEKNSIPFAFLFGDNLFYRGRGFCPIVNTLRYWKYETMEWREEFIGAAQVKTYQAVTWPEGVIDLAGPLF